MTVRPSSRPRVKILQAEPECGMDSISRLPLCSHLLQQTLRGVCVDSEWVYSVFWRILPRNFPPPKWELGGYLDRSKANKRNWMLVWEDGFCDFARSLAAQEGNANSTAGTASGKGSVNSTSCDTGAPAAVTSSLVMNDPRTEKYTGGLHPELFFKMSHEVYNYGEGLMGKVAADNGHKWVYKDPPERDNRLVSFWHSTIDPQPRIWEAQFKCGIQTIVVIAVREGLVQLGSTRQILEDLNFVVLLQRKFNNLQQAMNPNVVQPASSNFGTQCYGTSPDSLERKVRHGRPDRDESPVRRTLERRLSWSGTVSDSRRSRPLLDDLHHHLAPPLADQSSASSSATSSSGSPWYHSNPLADANSSFSVGGSTPLTQHGAGIRSSSCAASKSGSGVGGVMSVLPSMTNLQVLLSKLPAVTSSNSSIPLPHQLLNSEPDVLNHSPLLRTLSAPAPASAASAPPPHEYPADFNRPPLSSVSSGAFHMPRSATGTVPAMMGDHHPFLIVTPPRHEYDEVEDDKATLCSRTELETKATLCSRVELDTKATLCSRVELDTKALSKVQVDLYQPADQLTPGSPAAAVASATTDQPTSLRHEQLGNANILRQGAVANVSSSPESFDENLITDLGLQADKMLTTYLDDIASEEGHASFHL